MSNEYTKLRQELSLTPLVALALNLLRSHSTIFDTEGQCMNEPREHSPRQIYIRNHLYVVFEEMANEIGCTIDYLVNEAMRTYARAQNASNALDESLIPPVSSGPPPLPPSNQPAQFAPAGSRPLYLWFNQQRYVIDQPRFIIGRGGQNKHLS